MKFIVEDKIFDTLPDLYFGVVIARGIDNTALEDNLLAGFVDSQKKAEERFAKVDLKKDPSIMPYREAFQTLGINPNKFRCSIEALIKRIAKGGRIPTINTMVDLVNTISLNNVLPMGCHDIDAFDSDIWVRYAKEGDVFVPFGSEENDPPDVGEVVYASGNRIKTRRWIWRQSEIGKAVEETKNFFMPIDGFKSQNGEAVNKAANELAKVIEETFGISTEVAFLDKENPMVEI
ncbi:MAG TPA: phenylalanine--tRNA ligase beta subunit-related protein [Clostridia bacterium]|nr:phenylalanine--tRNA ligase beta subunit-related protein [Clostridia bacterium]